MRRSANQCARHTAVERETEANDAIVGEDHLGQADLVCYGGTETGEEERACPSAALLRLPLHQVNRKARSGQRPDIEPMAEHVTNASLSTVMCW